MVPDLLFFSAPGSLFPTIVAAVFGLLIGSFLNVVIYRMPKMMEREFENACAEHAGGEPVHTDVFTLSVPRSACPCCGHKITAMENIPVLSALMVWHFGSGWAGMGAMVFALFLLAMTMIDFDTQFLPDDLTYPLLWLGLLINLNATFASLQAAVIGAAAGYMALWSVNALYKLVRKTDGMGNGDFKLLAALGAWMGWSMLPTIILLSSAVGAVVGISLIVFGKNGRETRIPFGPYLAGAGLLAMLFGERIGVMSQQLLLGS